MENQSVWIARSGSEGDADVYSVYEEDGWIVFSGSYEECRQHVYKEYHPRDYGYL